MNEDNGRFEGDLLDFLQCTGGFSSLDAKERIDLHADAGFMREFRHLDRLMKGEGSKRLKETARVDRFPRRDLLPPAVNLGVFYVTGLLYCLARLSLLAVGFSSLRQMPESVYVSTPWTVYIPTLGSGS